MKKESLSFAQMKEELEYIVENMESPSCSYEELKKLYERGEMLASRIEAMLSADLEAIVQKIKAE